MARTDLVRAMVEPLAAEAGASVYDVTMASDKLVVALTRPDGIDLDTIASITRALNARLDEEEPISGSYTLEVTSPGLERTLRTVEHFAGAVGSEVTIRTKPGVEGERRVRGVLRAVDAEAATVTVDLDAADASDGDGGQRTLAVDDVERARTVFTWGPAPKPGGKNKPTSTSKSHANKEARS